MIFKKIIFSTSVFLLLSLSSCSSQDAASDEKTEVEAEPIDTNAAPKFWQEHWFEHNQLLKLQAYNDEVVVYYDKDVDRNIEWPKDFFTQTWKYVKQTYGSFGEEGRLYVVLHSGKYGGGHPSVYVDASHDYRNVLDAGNDTWAYKKTGKGLNLAVHEIGHIVEGITNGVKENPAWEIWKDSKWAEIFIYDVYKGIGEEAFALQAYDEFIKGTDDFPKPQTHWFKDWFYPLYSQYGESKTLSGFYNLLDAYFPKDATGKKFSRRMNMGEFIHFWSGAAKHDLQSLAEDAFGWNTEWQTQLDLAKKTFPDIKY